MDDYSDGEEAGGGVDKAVRAELDVQRFDRDYFLPNKPVHITDLAFEWPALKKWSPEYFASEFRYKLTSVNFNEQGVFDANETAITGPVTRMRLPFSEAVSRITARRGGRYYMQQSELSGFGGLAADVRLPYLLDEPKELVATNLWFGGKGCKSPLHYDLGDNFLVQVFGGKRILLISPDSSTSVYPAIGQNLPHCSLVNVFDPDFRMYPEYERAHRRATPVELGPGEGLFIPHRWWHAVESTEVSASVNFWWTGSTLPT
ncbi:cupin-like domain-containing protein [Streptomyces fuscichromogenes]|uniref:JmjC domain-containing protein n=1 Tax=Streptomyces fuscichromogenes TaxID=1324013 RepID=A0A918CXG5_9ACTN|nr:cupin-like domain-containing protein [Streptomyces fuscichromogenes]GGN45479.1 hypothetical protein GCM10011578_097470 [Streptomyces fuscichromogenes]